MNAKSVTRDALFNAVWDRPLNQVAVDYGITGTGLAKLCDRHAIPRPPQGHWIKAEHGKAARRPALPEAKDGTPTLITIVPQGPNVRSSGNAGDGLAEAGLEAPKASTMVVPKRLANPHPIVQRWLDDYQRSTFRASQDHTGWAIKPSPWTEIDRRRHRIISTILKSLSTTGIAAEQDANKLCICRGPDRVEIALREKRKQIKRAINKEERRWLYDDRTHVTELEPTGTLLFEIKEWLSGIKKTWQEKDESLLEEEVPEIVRTLILALHLQKQRRLEREAQHREYERKRQLELETQRQREREQKRWDDLVAHAKAWKERELVREFLDKPGNVEAIQDRLADGLSTEDWNAWLRSRLS